MTHSLKIVQTGMRQGELPVLKWEDVDLNEGVIHVRRTLACSGGRIAIGEPKTKSSWKTSSDWAISTMTTASSSPQGSAPSSTPRTCAEGRLRSCFREQGFRR